MVAATQNSVDRHIGRKLQLARAMAGLSVDELARAVDVSGDQVLRWEAGGSLGASDLFIMAKILNQPLPYFFEGLADRR
jgi:transcriptional regulator with XRE-family HTH domain